MTDRATWIFPVSLEPFAHRPGRTVDPDPAWAEGVAARYQRFLTVAS